MTDIHDFQTFSPLPDFRPGQVISLSGLCPLALEGVIRPVMSSASTRATSTSCLPPTMRSTILDISRLTSLPTGGFASWPTIPAMAFGIGMV